MSIIIAKTTKTLHIAAVAVHDSVHRASLAVCRAVHGLHYSASAWATDKVYAKIDKIDSAILDEYEYKRTRIEDAKAKLEAELAIINDDYASAIDHAKRQRAAQCDKLETLSQL